MTLDTDLDPVLITPTGELPVATAMRTQAATGASSSELTCIDGLGLPISEEWLPYHPFVVPRIRYRSQLRCRTSGLNAMFYALIAGFLNNDMLLLLILASTLLHSV